MVHSVEVNPVDYAMSSIIGAGLGDKEITSRTFNTKIFLNPQKN